MGWFGLGLACLGLVGCVFAWFGWFGFVWAINWAWFGVIWAWLGWFGFVWACLDERLGWFVYPGKWNAAEQTTLVKMSPNSVMDDLPYPLSLASSIIVGGRIV